MIESRENFLNMYLNYLDDSRENILWWIFRTSLFPSLWSNKTRNFQLHAGHFHLQIFIMVAYLAAFFPQKHPSLKIFSLKSVFSSSNLFSISIDRSINQSICFYNSNFRMLLMIEISLSLLIHVGLEYENFLQFWLLSIIKWMCFCISFSNSVKIYIEALEVIIRQIMCW